MGACSRTKNNVTFCSGFVSTRCLNILSPLLLNRHDFLLDACLLRKGVFFLSYNLEKRPPSLRRKLLRKSWHMRPTSAAPRPYPFIYFFALLYRLACMTWELLWVCCSS